MDPTRLHEDGGFLCFDPFGDNLKVNAVATLTNGRHEFLTIDVNFDLLDKSHIKFDTVGHQIQQCREAIEARAEVIKNDTYALLSASIETSPYGIVVGDGFVLGNLEYDFVARKPNLLRIAHGLGQTIVGVADRTGRHIYAKAVCQS